MGEDEEHPHFLLHHMYPLFFFLQLSYTALISPHLGPFHRLVFPTFNLRSAFYIPLKRPQISLASAARSSQTVTNLYAFRSLSACIVCNNIP